MRNNRCGVNVGTLFHHDSAAYVILIRGKKGLSIVSLPVQERMVLGTHDAGRDLRDGLGVKEYGFEPLADSKAAEEVLAAYNFEHPPKEEPSRRHMSFGALLWLLENK